MSTKSWHDYFNVWKYTFKLSDVCPQIKLSIKGHSVGSESSGFYIPELQLYLDAGIRSYFVPRTILVTHGHTDHAYMLPLLLYEATKNTRVYVPAEGLELFQTWNFDAFKVSQNCLSNVDEKYEQSSYDLTARIQGAQPGQDIELGKGYLARVYDMDHTIPCRGYGLYTTRKKLKPEYKTWTKEQIKASKDKSVLTETVYDYNLAYLCDTTIKVFEQEEILQYAIIMVECTFWCDDTWGKITNKHIHWRELKPIVEKHPHIYFILIHPSSRYKYEDLEKQCQDVKNCMLWPN